MEYNTNLAFTQWRENNGTLTAVFGKDADMLTCSYDVVAAVAANEKVDVHPMLLPAKPAAEAAINALNFVHA